MSPRDAAAKIQRTYPSAAVKRLGALGHLESSTDPRDTRQHLLSLTPLGRDAMSAASVLDSARLEKLVSMLSPRERVAAVRVLELLAGAAARAMTSGGRS